MLSRAYRVEAGCCSVVFGLGLAGILFLIYSDPGLAHNGGDGWLPLLLTVIVLTVWVATTLYGRRPVFGGKPYDFQGETKVSNPVYGAWFCALVVQICLWSFGLQKGATVGALTLESLLILGLIAWILRLDLVKWNQME
jgi:hypothetical protein